MAENSRFRRRLFLSLRLGVILNILVFLAFFVSAFYSRSRVRLLQDSVVALSLRNADLSQRLSLALFTLTNDYFRAAGDFVASFSNRVRSVALSTNSDFSLPGNLLEVTNNVPLPVLKFHTYFEANGVSYCYLKRRLYKAGDFILGFPITEISPDAVEYRGAYFPIEEITK